ncbi:MAG: hypothetical protein ACLFP4_05630 [Spirochaetales bacterium]
MKRPARPRIWKARAHDFREIVMLEPFLLPYPEDHQQMCEDFDPKLAICR